MGPNYTYRAKVERIIDGDTIVVSIDLGFDAWLHHQSIRLEGVDTPEIRGPERPEGLVAKEFVEGLLPVSSEVIIQTRPNTKRKSFDRWVAQVYYRVDESSWGNLGQVLLAEGLAEPY